MKAVGSNPFNRARFTSQKTKTTIDGRGSNGSTNKFDVENNSSLKVKLKKKVQFNI